MALALTPENLPIGQARCSCEECFEIIIGNPGEELCAVCGEFGCSVGGEVCQYEKATGFRQVVDGQTEGLP